MTFTSSTSRAELERVMYTTQPAIAERGVSGIITGTGDIEVGVVPVADSIEGTQGDMEWEEMVSSDSPPAIRPQEESGSVDKA